jgi:hypothetical protein
LEKGGLKNPSIPFVTKPQCPFGLSLTTLVGEDPKADDGAGQIRRMLRQAGRLKPNGFQQANGSRDKSPQGWPVRFAANSQQTLAVPSSAESCSLFHWINNSLFARVGNLYAKLLILMGGMATEFIIGGHFRANFPVFSLYQGIGPAETTFAGLRPPPGSPRERRVGSVQ